MPALPTALPPLLLAGGPPFFDPAAQGTYKQMALAWHRRGGRVLYLELGGDPKPYRARRSEAGGEPVPAAPGFHVLRLERLPGVPWSYPAAARNLYLRLRRGKVQRALEQLDFRPDRFIALYYGWFWAQWMEALPAAAHVYDCVDEHRAYGPIAGHPARVREVWTQEQRMLAQADLLLVTSPVLLKDRAAHARAALCLPNAVDPLAFRPAVEGACAEPPDLAGLPRPRAVLHGNLQGKLDFDAVVRIAQAASDGTGNVASVALLGPCEKGLRLPRNSPRLQWLGAKAYEALPSYLAHVQVGLLPLRPTDYNYGSCPVKLLELLASGLPVVSSRIPIIEVWARRWPEWVVLANAPDEFPAACARALAAGQRASRAEIAQSVAGCTWAARVEALVAELHRLGRLVGI